MERNKLYSRLTSPHTVSTIIFLCFFPVLAITRNYKIIRFSEVCFWADESESEWIELYNSSDSVINLNNWYLKWSETDSLIITVDKEYQAKLILDPLDIMVITFDGSKRAPTEYNDTTVLFYSDSTYAHDVLKSSGLIYLVEPLGNTADFVKWGTSMKYLFKSKIEDHQIRFLKDEYLYSDNKISFKKVVIPNGTIGLIGEEVEDQFWAVYTPDEANKGHIDQYGVRRAPLQSLPLDNQPILKNNGNDSYSTINCFGMGSFFKYQFQVCVDRNCQIPITTSDLLPVPSFKLYDSLAPLEDGEFIYWRVRGASLVKEDTLFSIWSTARKALSPAKYD